MSRNPEAHVDIAQGAQDVIGERKRITVPVYNLQRGGGTGAVEMLLESAAGVRYVYVNALMEMAYLEYDACLTDPRHLAALLAGAGFGPPHL